MKKKRNFARITKTAINLTIHPEVAQDARRIAICGFNLSLSQFVENLLRAEIGKAADRERKTEGKKEASQ
jgi:hypothetical protein